MGIVIRQSVKGAAITYVGVVLGFLTTFFIVTKLDPEVLGLSRVLIQAALVLSGFAQLGCNYSMVRYFPYFQNKEKNNNGFFFYSVLIPLIGFILVVAIIFLFRTPVANYFKKESELFLNYYYCLIPLTFFLLYWLVFETYSTVLMRIAVPNLIREVVVRSLLVGVYLLFYLGITGVDGFVFSFTAIYGVVMLIAFFYVARIGSVSLQHDRTFLTPALKKDFFSYTGFLVLGSLGSVVINSADILIISAEMGLDYTGIYFIATSIVVLIEIPSRSISSISSPLVSSALQKRDMEEATLLYRKVALHQLLAGGLIFLLIWINIDNIYAIIPKGEFFSKGKSVVLFLGVAKLIQITLNFGNRLIGFSKFYRWTLFLTLLIAAISLLGNYLLIPRIGLAGAAIATLISTMIFSGIQQLIVQIRLKSNPFSVGIFKTIGLIFFLILLGKVLPALQNPFADMIYRTLSVGLLALLLVYMLRISEEVNALLRKYTLLAWKKISGEK